MKHTPKENGWLYVAFNMDPVMKENFDGMMNDLVKDLGMKKKKIIYKLVLREWLNTKKRPSRIHEDEKIEGSPYQGHPPN